MTDLIRLTEEDFASGRCIAQGEVRVWMKKYAPECILKQTNNLKELAPENGMLILGHSETGHHHGVDVLDKPGTPNGKNAQALIDSINGLIGELRMYDFAPFKHSKNASDAHRGYLLPPGEYVFENDVEFTPEGMRRVAD